MQNQDNVIKLGSFHSDDFSQENYIDIHCHCLHGLDDGPGTMSESVELCRALSEDGITTVIATPHQLGQFSGCNRSDQVREAVLVLNEELKRNDISLKVLAGADVRLDERICQLLEEDNLIIYVRFSAFLYINNRCLLSSTIISTFSLIIPLS